MAKDIYVKNEDNDMIYKLVMNPRDFVEKGGDSYWVVGLDLVCGKDWVEVNDYGGIQGWIPAEYFTDTWETLVVYVVKESVESCLEEWGYTIIDKLPRIQTPRE